jgi:hypothetical protein
MMITLDAMQLYDGGFGPHLVPVTPPKASPISPRSTLSPKMLGKAPGWLTNSGWIGVDCRDHSWRCNDYETAKSWRDLGVNIGLAGGEGVVIFDNDQGPELSALLDKAFRDVGLTPLRRYVHAPKHGRDAFIVRVREPDTGEPTDISSFDLTFRNGVGTGKIQVLAQGKQLVIAGTHPGTLGPYVWDRDKPFSFDDLPTVVGDKGFEKLLDALEKVCGEGGWTTTRLTGGAAVSGVSVPPPVSQIVPPPEIVKVQIDNAKTLLEQIPNRDVPQGETPNAVDQWLDDYENWRNIAYALAAFLGPSANTPEAETLWEEWANGRVVQNQDPLSVWRSVLRQPLRYGGVGLVKLLRREGFLPPEEFPDIAPNDPLLAKQTWARIQARYALHCPDGDILDLITGAILSPKAFMALYKREVGDLIGELHITVGPRSKPPNAYVIFLDQPDRQEVNGVTYAPGDPRFTLSVDASRDRIFNRWRSPSLSLPANPIAESEIQPWLDHIDFVLGPTERQRFLKWCAFVVQHPELKPKWHYLVISEEGLGKDIMLQPLERAIGVNNCVNDTVDSLESQFHYHLLHKLIVISETGQSQRDWHTRQNERKLKKILASPPNYFDINLKKEHPFRIPNRSAVVLFSNESKPLRLDRGQRRLYVINRKNVQHRDEAYYDDLKQWLNANQEKAAAFLLALPLSDADKRNFRGGRAPDSTAKRELEELGLEPAKAVLEELIDDASKDLMGPLATVSDLAATLRNRGHIHTTEPAVFGWLLEMEQRGKGVGRVKKGNGPAAGVCRHRSQGARLWHLTEDYKGRAWSDLSNKELFDVWEGRPLQQGTPFPATSSVDEKV